MQAPRGQADLFASPAALRHMLSIGRFDPGFLCALYGRTRTLMSNTLGACDACDTADLGGLTISHLLRLNVDS